MKKLFFVILGLVMLFSFGSCNNSKTHSYDCVYEWKIETVNTEGVIDTIDFTYRVPATKAYFFGRMTETPKNCLYFKCDDNDVVLSGDIKSYKIVSIKMKAD